MLYVEWLIDRMHRTGFPADDSLYLAAVQARDGMRTLVTVAAKAADRPQWQRAMDRQRRSPPVAMIQRSSNLCDGCCAGIADQRWRRVHELSVVSL